MPLQLRGAECNFFIHRSFFFYFGATAIEVFWSFVANHGNLYCMIFAASGEIGVNL